MYCWDYEHQLPTRRVFYLLIFSRQGHFCFLACGWCLQILGVIVCSLSSLRNQYLMSAIVTSLAFASVISSAALRHFCRRLKGRLATTFFRLSGFLIWCRYPISFNVFLQVFKRAENDFYLWSISYAFYISRSNPVWLPIPFSKAFSSLLIPFLQIHC